MFPPDIPQIPVPPLLEPQTPINRLRDTEHGKLTKDWRSAIATDRYGAEAWLSNLFTPLEGATLYQPWPVDQYPTPSPYDQRIYKATP